ncbi:hypothetical protein B0T21DRAFT_378726 [Apiosordaria backusii]|uniref:Uncharacterized protein n=1 Tax=Apiosordaria backusii TaxID=314023 RepID=A0AA39ZPU8_9PEZI|nr:hypothetical protein B0T21DRAFT_378726 [Apiosordaria backusii]
MITSHILSTTAHHHKPNAKPRCSLLNMSNPNHLHIHVHIQGIIQPNPHPVI